MTWNAKDLPKTWPPAAGDPLPPSSPTAAATPRVALAAELADTRADDWTPSPELRRELAQAGLIDETTWAATRRLLTRGLIAE
jgi:hypothetical protein